MIEKGKLNESLVTPRDSTRLGPAIWEPLDHDDLP